MIPSSTNINFENRSNTLRVKIAITPEESFAWSEINQNLLVGLVWNVLRGTEYEILHDQRGFKFFTFSEIFPFGDFQEGVTKHIIISSPDRKFVETVADRIGNGFSARLGAHPVVLSVEKTFRLKPKRVWETASPVVVRKDDRQYWREDKDTLGEFVQNITENAVAKYRAYYGEDFELPTPLFEGYEFLKGVVHSFRKSNGNKVMIIGSKWRFTLPAGWTEFRRFYWFLMDCGIGEKNAMGYGFVNPVKRGGERGD